MSLAKRAFAELLGTAGLLTVVVGSGIMGERLAGGQQALALLANSLATGAGLFSLIQTFGPISGAHFNPAVSLTEYFWKRLGFAELVFYLLAQVAGAFIGVCVAHAMFGLSLLQSSVHDRSEPRLWFSELIATLGLILVIAFSGRKNVETTPLAVSLYIISAYWWSSSTSFANPAVTLARSFTDTFAGIRGDGVPAFVVAQLSGAAIGFALSAIFTETSVATQGK